MSAVRGRAPVTPPRGGSFLRALLVVDAQNEFSPAGQRPVPHHAAALAAIRRWAAEARHAGRPIAWVRHYNRPTESRAFVPGTSGSELSPGLGPQAGYGPERVFELDVFGAFTGTELEAWLRGLGVTDVLIVGFFTHMCVSTSAREALVRGFVVVLAPEATGARVPERRGGAALRAAPASHHGRDARPADAGAPAVV